MVDTPSKQSNHPRLEKLMSAALALFLLSGMATVLLGVWRLAELVF